MLQRISFAIVTRANRKSLIITAIFFLAMQYLISISPFGVQAVKSVAPGVTILDMQLNYSPADAHKTLLDLQESGRKVYVQMLLIDFVFIIAYTPFLMVSLTLLYRFFFPKNRLYRIIWVVPLASGFFDVLENCGTLVQLKAFPEALPVVARISNVFTMSKFVTAGLCEVTLGIGAIIWLLVIMVRAMKRDWRNAKSE